MLDTCVWLEYIWQILAENDRTATQSKKIIDRLNGDNNYQIILSPFLIREISSHYKDWFILQKIIKDGFSFNEFKQIKMNYELEETEKEKIDDIIIKIGNISNVNVLINSGLGVSEVEKILELESIYSFDIYDALHFNTALEEKSDFFITKDGKLRISASRYNKSNGNKIECMPPKSFLKIL